jgi:hypothetical protein
MVLKTGTIQSPPNFQRRKPTTVFSMQSDPSADKGVLRGRGTGAEVWGWRGESKGAGEGVTFPILSWRADLEDAPMNVQHAIRNGEGMSVSRGWCQASCRMGKLFPSVAAAIEDEEIIQVTCGFTRTSGW